MAYVQVDCRYCEGVDVVRNGTQRKGEQGYRCNYADCQLRMFLL